MQGLKLAQGEGLASRSCFCPTGPPDGTLPQPPPQASTTVIGLKIHRQLCVAADVNGLQPEAESGTVLQTVLLKATSSPRDASGPRVSGFVAMSPLSLKRGAIRPWPSRPAERQSGSRSLRLTILSPDHHSRFPTGSSRGRWRTVGVTAEEAVQRSPRILGGRPPGP